MKQSILDDNITGKIQNQLWQLGYKCRAQRLVFFTDKPFCVQSKLLNRNLDEPYITKLGYKTAVKIYESMKKWMEEI